MSVQLSTLGILRRLASEKPALCNCLVQIITPKQAEYIQYSINDFTEIWPHKNFQLKSLAELFSTPTLSTSSTRLSKLLSLLLIWCLGLSRRTTQSCN